MRKLATFFILSFLLFSCAKKIKYNDPIPKHDNFTIASKNVKEKRIINVWIPPNYDNNDIASYPVLYMPDGGIKEDFPHIANTLATLIESNSIPPYILVGIENTQRGRDLTGFSETEGDESYCPLTDGAKNFRAFITNELMPEINRTYRTSNKKGIIGESLAGLFVMETFFLNPESFDFYIAMDPSVWWNNHYLVRNAEQLLAKMSVEKTKLWFAGSSAIDISQYTNNMAESIEQNAPKGLTWKYSEEADEKHATIFRATKEKALIWSLNDTKSN